MDDDAESFFCRFTFGQFFAILLLEVFTLFFVFYLGARYGREFLGLERSGQHIAEQQGELPQPLEEAPKAVTTEDPEVAKMAKDLIEKAKTPELKERIAGMLGTDVAGKKLPGTKPKEAAPTPEEPETASASPQPSNVVRVKSGDAAKYAIQIGSYHDVTEANAAIETWKTKGYPAYLMIADIPNRGRWYRIRIGGFGAREDAESYLSELKTQENVDGLVVLNEQ